MTKAMMTLAAAMAAGVAVAGECTAVIRGLDGQPRTKELVGTREADGAIRYVLPAAEAKDADWIDFRMDRATAATGEAGFWMMGRGVIGRFTRSHGGWTNGARVYVNHNTESKTADGIELKPVDWKLVRK